MNVNEWINLWTGKPIDEDGAYGNQCWDLAQKYCREIIGCPRLPTRIGGNGFAYDCYEQFLAPLPRYFNRIANNPANPNQVPLPGDLIVFKNSLGGHIAVVIEAKPGNSFVKVFQQNAPVGHLPEVGNLSYDGCLGWLAPIVRPSFGGELPASDNSGLATPGMPDGEFYTIQKGNTLWGLEEVWGLPHGTLTSLNAGQDPRTLRIGQQIRIRHAAPVEPAPAPAPSDETRVIESGDTFWDIENELGLPHGTLQQLNPSMTPRLLRIGDRIITRLANPAAAPAPAAPVIEAPIEPAAPIDEPAVGPSPLVPLTPAGLDEALRDMPANTPVLVVNEPDGKETFAQKHFSKQKLLVDLAALASFFAAGVAWYVGHYEFIAVCLNILTGILFGGNRFKGGR